VALAEAAERPRPATGRLLAWCLLIGVVAAGNFAARAAGDRPGSTIFYDWTNAIGGTIQYAVLLGLALVIAIGLPWRDVFALRRPTSWPRAGGIALGVLAAMLVAGTIVGQFGNPSKEQGLTPHHWHGDKAIVFAANLFVVSVAAPVVEELLFRGLGFSVLARFGQPAAIVLVGLAFGLWHGLVIAFPLLALFGAGLAYMRARTGSVFPGMVLHALFNTFAVVTSLLSG
jgi:membrane protease YdiL (CAAX protease family)